MQAQQPPQQQAPPPAVLVFLKSLATPLVLYTPNVLDTFVDIKDAMKNAKSASPKLIEKETLGPLKIVYFWDTEIAGAALQMEVAQQPSASPAGASTRLAINPLNKGSFVPPSSPSLKK